MQLFQKKVVKVITVPQNILIIEPTLLANAIPFFGYCPFKYFIEQLKNYGPKLPLVLQIAIDLMVNGYGPLSTTA